MLGPQHPLSGIDDRLSMLPRADDIAERVESLREIVSRLECVRVLCPKHAGPRVEYGGMEQPGSSGIALCKERGAKAAHREQRQWVVFAQQSPSRLEYGFLQRTGATEIRQRPEGDCKIVHGSQGVWMLVAKHAASSPYYALVQLLCTRVVPPEVKVGGKVMGRPQRFLMELPHVPPACVNDGFEQLPARFKIPLMNADGRKGSHGAKCRGVLHAELPAAHLEHLFSDGTSISEVPARTK